MLTDEETRDGILDDDLLSFMLLLNIAAVCGSALFYILVRHVFRKSGIADRAVADYVAVPNSRTPNVRVASRRDKPPTGYFFEMMAALQTADDRTTFPSARILAIIPGFCPACFRKEFGSAGDARFPGLEILRGPGPQLPGRSRSSAGRKYDLAGAFDTLSERFRPLLRAE